MTRRLRLGVIVPSSNTVVEPLTTAIISSIRDDGDLDVTVHFSRFRVTKINLSEEADSQFLQQNMLAAAELLADAEVDVIGWSGTSAGWLGFEKDEKLCRAIQETTGVPATTSILTMNQLLHLSKGRTLGLVTPYVQAVNEAIRKNYRTIGVDIAERLRGLEMTENSEFALVTEAQMDSMVSDVVRQGSDIVAIFCTNLRAAQRAVYWESQGITVLDSVATVIWGMLRLLDVPPSCIKGWGKLFDI